MVGRLGIFCSLHSSGGDSRGLQSLTRMAASAPVMAALPMNRVASRMLLLCVMMIAPITSDESGRAQRGRWFRCRPG